MSKIPSYNLDSVISPELTHAFLKNMWNPGYGQGLYFSALHELDEHMFTPIRIDGQWVYSPHAIYDGFSLLNYLNKSDPRFQLKYTLETPFQPPKLFGWIKALKSALTSKPIEQHTFIKQLPYDKKLNRELQIFNIEFSVEETNSFKGLNLTSILLKKLSTFFMLKLSRNKTTRWMVPVNINGPFKEAKLSHMNASYIGLNCSLDNTSEDIKSELVSKLKKGEQWGYWLMGRIGLFGGKKIILEQTIKSLDKKNSDWFGSFSNLGNIGGIETSPEMLIMPIVRWHRPIGCVIYIYRNKLNLTVALHPSLALDEKTLEEYKNEIYQSILSK